MDRGEPEAGAHWLNLEQPYFGQQLTEALVFLFLIVPSMVLSFFVGQLANLNFVRSPCPPLRGTSLCWP